MYIQGLDDWQTPEETEHLQIQDDEEDLAPKYTERDPFKMADFAGVGGFDPKTKVPERFTAERDDRLMSSIFEKYAIEVKVDGERTGHLFCNKEAAKSLSQEVLATH